MLKLAPIILVFGLIAQATIARIDQPADQVPNQPSATPADAVVSARWKGTIELPDGMPLDFTATLAGDVSTIDVPAQGATGLPLSDVATAGKSLKFTLKPPGAPEAAWAIFDVTISDDGASAAGFMTQSGFKMPVKMTPLREGESTGSNRPQEPKPPFPYAARDVQYTNERDGTLISGTLTIPPGAGPHPAVLLITGSGAQDRDESLLGHKPFLVIADHLTRHGIAVLRCDDRGVGGTSGSIEQSTTEDFAHDALAGVAFLKAQPGIDTGRIGLVGHSEGGVIAPMAAAWSKDVAFIVLLAGTGIPGDELLLIQGELITRAEGASDEEVAEAIANQRELLAAIKAGMPREEFVAKLRQMGERQLAKKEASADPAEREKAAAARQNMEPVIQAQTAQSLSAWMRFFVSYDPRTALRKVTCPVLALNGEKDLQVPPQPNLPEIEKALKEGGNTDVTIVEIPRLNHLFQTTDTGKFSEYATIEETFSPIALDAMTSWIRERAGLASPTK